MTRLAIIAALMMPVAALADTCQLSKSTATLRDTSDPRADAEIFFDNSTGDQRAEAVCGLSHGAIQCSARMIVGGAEPDTMEPECPGYVAVPRQLTIADGTHATVILIPLGKVGF